MTHPAPLVSVVIPYYNAGSFITSALRQLAAQTFRDFEIIIVDDGSSPTEAAFAKGAAATSNATYIWQQNTGPGGARNLGASVAQGEWISFLDVDDRWDSAKLAKQMEVSANYDMVMCDTCTVAMDGTVIGVHHWSSLANPGEMAQAILNNQVHSFTSSLLVRTGAFRALGGFDERLRFLEDHHLLYRIVTTSRWTCLNEPLSRRVIHSESMSHLSRNLDFDDQIARRELFLNIIKERDPKIDPTPYLVREYHTNIKRCIVLGRRKKAARLMRQALRLDPFCPKSYAFAGAIALSLVKNSYFDRWNPELAQIRKSLFKGALTCR
ncbi:MAG: glycosyltransferase family 2 protein [Alphaproteobacteria bacterium]|nr:glycosyltransferase family 2 protein [Alphaproteobacteria bacterium]